MANVTYIHQHFKLPTESGGSRPYEFSRRLASDGHNVTVICGGSRSRRTTVDGVRIIYIRAPYSGRMNFGGRVLSFVRFMLAASLVSISTRADIVFASSTPLTVAVPGILGSLANRARFVFEVRDLWPAVPIQMGQLSNPVLIRAARLLERWAYRKAAKVVALSDGMARGVRDVESDSDIVVIPNASDVETFDSGDLPSRLDAKRLLNVDDGPLLAYAGSLGISYDPEWIADYSSALIRFGVQVRIAGQGAGMETIASRLIQSGIDPETILLGAVPKSKVALLLRASDATISSLAEYHCLEDNSLNKVFDSFAASRAIVANHAGWLSDIISTESVGLIVPREAEVAAANTLRWLETRDVAGEESRAGRLGRVEYSREALYRLFYSAVTGESVRPSGYSGDY
ncbi:glycosyltransferase family 4 protein [Dietzia massiliensis]|uniref:glycosyltransferase family 4 protein n=1 Tax=Dietzia massiliensis TaxID=2697499 RepID=UPI001F39F740|nr:glycosyltransferase family 4 protein [Dietzia massiliensis]